MVLERILIHFSEMTQKQLIKRAEERAEVRIQQNTYT